LLCSWKGRVSIAAERPMIPSTFWVRKSPVIDDDDIDDDIDDDDDDSDDGQMMMIVMMVR
jgi:hypothetical protein